MAEETSSLRMHAQTATCREQPDVPRPRVASPHQPAPVGRTRASRSWLRYSWQRPFVLSSTTISNTHFLFLRRGHWSAQRPGAHHPRRPRGRFATFLGYGVPPIALPVLLAHDFEWSTSSFPCTAPRSSRAQAMSCRPLRRHLPASTGAVNLGSRPATVRS